MGSFSFHNIGLTSARYIGTRKKRKGLILHLLGASA